MQTLFKWINRLFMVPAFRLGLGPLMGNPLSGYIMVIESTGRKSGKRRFTPVNYAILDGVVYCLAGFGGKAHWLLNLRAKPDSHLIIPGRRVPVIACEITDASVRLKAARQVLVNGGFAGFFFGFNPRTASDERLEKALTGIPVIAFDAGVQPRAGDPGGYLWLIWPFIIAVIWIMS